MNRSVRALAVAMMLFGALPPVSAADAGDLPEGYVSAVLPNGLRVSILPDPSFPVVSTQLWYQVGSANEDEGSRGLAHLFEHLMFGETATREAGEYSRFHHRHGGSENAWTSPDETVYISEIPPGPHAGVLAREADRMTHLVLTRENLDNEIRIVTEELRLATENDPTARLFHEAVRALLGEHPYAIWPTGTKEDIAAATVDSCGRFYERFYGPANAHLVIAGPVDAASTLEIVEERFGGIPASAETPPDVPSLLTWEFPEEIALEEDLPPVEIAVLGFPLPPPGSRDRWSIAVMTQMLAGGQIDPFRDELVRRRHKAIEAGTEVLALRRGGAVAFYSVNLPYRRKKTAFRLMEQTRDELSRLEWLNEEALAAAKRSLKRRELGREYYAASMADRIGRARWWYDDERAAFDREARIDAVSLDAVREAWRRYIGEPSGVRLYVRPERVPLWIRLFGWLYPLVD